MATALFYPHRFSPEALTLKLAQVPSNTTRRPDGTIDAYSEEPERVELELEMTVDLGELGSTVPPGTSLEDTIDVLLVTRSIAGRRREASKLESPFETETYRLTLDRAVWAGEVDVLVIAVRSCPGEGGMRFAGDRGAILAGSESIRVQFDEPSVPPGNNLDVEWVRFNDVPGLDEAHLYALQPVPSKPPKILLNSAFSGAYEVLTSGGRRGRKYRIKEATFHQIVHQGWSSILADLFDQLHGVIEDVADEDEPPTIEEALSDLLDWQANVLRDWANHLYPEEGGREAALERVIAETSQPGWEELLVSRMPRAIQSRFRTYRSFEGLVREAHLFSEEA